MGDANKMQKH